MVNIEIHIHIYNTLRGIDEGLPHRELRRTNHAL